MNHTYIFADNGRFSLQNRVLQTIKSVGFVYHQFRRNCISSKRSFVYHQGNALHIINSVGIAYHQNEVLYIINFVGFAYHLLQSKDTTYG